MNTVTRTLIEKRIEAIKEQIDGVNDKINNLRVDIVRKEAAIATLQNEMLDLEVSLQVH